MLALGMILIACDQTGRDNRARDFLRTEFHLDARAFELIDHGAERLAVADFEGKLGELLIERNAGVVTQAGDFAAAVVDGERFEHVVHFGGLEIKARRFAGTERSGALEIADTVLIEDNGANL